MIPGLNPTTFKTLKAFGRRRRWLLLLRGMCATLAASIAVLIVGSLLDYFFILSRPLRLTLSAFVYTVMVTVLIKTCLHPLARRIRLPELARLFEKHHDGPREEILSAVELGQEKPAPHLDSPAFRSHLQDQVAARLSSSNIQAMLPVQLVRRWMNAAGSALFLCAIFCLIPGLEAPRLFARLLAPLANFERVSRTKIRLVAPVNPDAPVPRSESFPIEIETSGVAAPEAFLEIFGSDGQVSRLAMDPAGARRFSCPLTVAGDSIEFRARAGDGATRRFKLRAATRPAVVNFLKTYHYPVYTRLKERQLAEANGDLDALEGTSVSLALAVDQPIAQAELQVACGATTQTIPLRPLATTTTTLSGVLRLTQSGDYRVRLVAAQTGFENTFRPTYEIRVQPDGPPTVSVTEPTGSVVVSERGQLMIVGAAKDDVALSRVSELLRIGQGEWHETVLAENPGADYPIQRRLRLAPLSLKPGAVVAVKFAARDGKGLAAESAVTTITIGNPDSAANRLKTDTERRLLQESLDQLRQAAKALGDEAKPLQSANPAQRKAELQKAREMADAAAQAATKSWQALQEATRGATTPEETNDLVMLGRILSQLRNDTLDRLRTTLDSAAKTPEPAKPDLDRAASLMRNVAWPADRLAGSHEELLLGAQAESASQEIRRIAREQSRITGAAQAARDPAEWNQLTARQAQNDADLATASGALDRMAARFPEWRARDLHQRIDQLKEARAQTEKALADKTPGAPLAGELQKLDDSLANHEPAIAKISEELTTRAKRVREELARSQSKTADAIRSIERDRRRPGSGLSWQGAIAALEDRAALEEARPDADYPFVQDTARAAEALRKLRASSPGITMDRPTQDSLRDIERAYGTIETAHDIEETGRKLSALSEKERAGITRSESPQVAEAWRGIESSLQDSRNQLSRLGFPKDANKEMNRILENASKGPDAQAIRNEMRDREKDRAGTRPMTPMNQRMDAMRGELEKVAGQVKAALPEARLALAHVAPTIGEQAAEAAKEAAALQQETAAQANPAKPDEGAPAAAKTLKKQKDFNKRLAPLQTALRREANAQDLATPAGRERARDADDALALLRQPPPQAEALLDQAARASTPTQRKNALNQAAAQQQELARSLHAIAQHYQSPDAATSADSRAALRQSEEQTGAKAALDAQYEDAARMADLAAQSPQDLRKALEAEVPRNPAMQSELSAIADDTAQKAEATLADAARQEGTIAHDLDTLAKTPPRRPPNLQPQTQRQQDLNLTTTRVATDLDRAALHAQRLNRPDATALKKAGAETHALSKNELPHAQQALDQADKTKKPAPAQQPVEQARDALARQAENLAAAQQPSTPSANSNAAARWMAQTLDRLDAAALAQATGQSQANAKPAKPNSKNTQPTQASASAQANTPSPSSQSLLQGAQQSLAQSRSARSTAPTQDDTDVGSSPPPPDHGNAALPQVNTATSGEWGKLRQQEAQDTAAGQKDAIAEDYRPMVNAYFKALARKGQQPLK